MSLLLALALLYVLLPTQAAPLFTDLAIVPSLTALNPATLGTALAPQHLIIDASTTNFTFDFSIATPSDFTGGITQVVLTTTPNLFAPAVNQSLSAFTTPLVIGADIPSVLFDVFIGNASTSSTYFFLATRAPTQKPEENDYGVFWIVIGVIAGTIAIIAWFVYVAYRAGRSVRGVVAVSLEETVSLNSA
jgi:hypothetical protein